MSTEDILTALNGLEEAPWGEIANGKPLNARGSRATSQAVRDQLEEHP